MTRPKYEPDGPFEDYQSDALLVGHDPSLLSQNLNEEQVLPADLALIQEATVLANYTKVKKPVVEWFMRNPDTVVKPSIAYSNLPAKQLGARRKTFYKSIGEMQIDPILGPYTLTEGSRRATRYGLSSEWRQSEILPMHVDRYVKVMTEAGRLVLPEARSARKELAQQRMAQAMSPEQRERLVQIDGLLKQGGSLETVLTHDGSLRIVSKGVLHGLYYGDTILPVQGSTLRILEIVSLQLDGISFGRLYGKVKDLTDGMVSKTSLHHHLLVIEDVFDRHEVPGWEYHQPDPTIDGDDRFVRLRGALPRRREEWPVYMRSAGRVSVSAESGEDDSRPGMYGLLPVISVDERSDWQERGLCAQTDPEAFFPDKGGSTREAKKICTGCEVKAECLEDALTKQERFGIRGGLSERERRRRRRRAV